VLTTYVLFFIASWTLFALLRAVLSRGGPPA
jgi:hypothetical protein